MPCTWHCLQAPSLEGLPEGQLSGDGVVLGVRLDLLPYNRQLFKTQVRRGTAEILWLSVQHWL